MRQTAALQAWLDQQRKVDTENKEPPKDRFGLTTEQLEQLHETLKLPFRESTKGKSASQLVQSIARRTKLRLWARRLQPRLYKLNQGNNLPVGASTGPQPYRGSVDDRLQ